MNSRTDFTIHKTYGALRWMIISGTATFFLTGLLEVVKDVEMPAWAVLLTYLIINTAIFAVAKYKEGDEI